ncbi:MAG: DUF4330 domain-containing protein [Clostridia bacterium]|nr:DUF4330 domain-containing protein [Clostridia bacterium]
MKKMNLIDIAVVVLIIALGFALYLKFGVYDHTKTEAAMSKIEYSIKIYNVRNYTADAFQVGDTVYDSQTKLAIGKIMNIETESAKTVKETTNGKAVTAENPNRYDVLLTIETDGMETEKAYFADRSVELKVGSEKQIETLYVKTNGTIFSIDVL